jgi:hypothetical protein
MTRWFSGGGLSTSVGCAKGWGSYRDSVRCFACSVECSVRTSQSLNSFRVFGIRWTGSFKVFPRVFKGAEMTC